MVSLEANNQACFLLYGLITVERRAISSDGKICYIVSFNKNNMKGLDELLSEYLGNYWESNVYDFESE
jgi:hypothetical protein